MQVKRVFQKIRRAIGRSDFVFYLTRLLVGIVIGVGLGIAISDISNISNEPEQAPIVENSVESVENCTLVETTTEIETTTEPQYIEMKVILTAYCLCGEICTDGDGITSTGVVPVQGRTVAVDPKVIPYGTEVIIDGHTYIAEDCGVSGNSIDIFFDSHAEALIFGRKSADVKIKV